MDKLLFRNGIHIALLSRFPGQVLQFRHLVDTRLRLQIIIMEEGTGHLLYLLQMIMEIHGHQFISTMIDGVVYLFLLLDSFKRPVQVFRTIHIYTPQMIMVILGQNIMKIIQKSGLLSHYLHQGSIKWLLVALGRLYQKYQTTMG